MCGPPDTWSATSCVPVVADPAVPGDPCTIMDHPYSGHDDCDLGSMCFNADPETLTGVCIPLCTGSDASPVCDDRGSACLVANQGALPICVPTCNPLEPTCDEGQGCYVGTLVAQFVCLPEGVPVGIDGETPAACPAGSTDVDSALLATCTDDDEACCAAFCDTFDPVCSDGLTCVAIDEDALVLNQVGVCVDAA
jgi:hypothetical protein